jgi:hypothetical protein
MSNRLHYPWRVYAVYPHDTILAVETFLESEARKVLKEARSGPLKAQLRYGPELVEEVSGRAEEEDGSFEVVCLHDDGEGGLLMSHRSSHQSIDVAKHVASLLASPPKEINIFRNGVAVTVAKAPKKTRKPVVKSGQKDLFTTTRRQGDLFQEV